MSTPGWMHIVSLCQIAMLIAALVETLIVHLYLRLGKQTLSMIIDETLRVALPAQLSTALHVHLWWCERMLCSPAPLKPARRSSPAQ